MTDDDDRLLQALACLPSIPRDAEWNPCPGRAVTHAIARQEHSRKRPAVITVAWLAAAAVLCAYLAIVFSAAARLGGTL